MTNEEIARFFNSARPHIQGNPNLRDPQAARVDSFMGLWFGATMLIGVGAGVVIVPLLTMWQAWKWAKRQEGTSV